MAQVTLTINGWPYTVGCDDGQEERVRLLGDNLHTRVESFAHNASGASEALLLVFAGLTMAEEQADLKVRLTALERQVEDDRIALEQATQRLLQQREELNSRRQGEDGLADRIMQLANRIETIAAELSTP